MANLMSFAKLEFMTVKPSIKSRQILLNLLLFVMMTFVMGPATSVPMIGTMLAILVAIETFENGEKYSLDILYSTMAVSRKTVVLGRYIFVLGFALCVALVFLVLLALMSLAGFPFTTGEIITSVGNFIVAFIAMQSFQIPVFFKLGYKKAKFLIMAPFILVAAVLVVFTMLTQDFYVGMEMRHTFGGVCDCEICTAMLGNRFLPMMLAALPVPLFISGWLSARFYARREF